MEQNSVIKIESKIDLRKKSKMKGKTYEEIYGTEKALELKKLRKACNLGRKHTNEARKNMSKARKGKTYEEIFGIEKAKELKKRKREHVFSEETRKKISIAGKGKIHSREWNEHVSKGLTGRKYSEESKKKMSESRKRLFANGYVHPQKGVPLPKWQVELLRVRNSRKHTEEEKKKSSEAGLKYYANPLTVHPFKGKKHKEESKLKTSKTLRNGYLLGKYIPPWLGKKNPAMSKYKKEFFIRHPEERIKQGNRIKERMKNPEFVKKIISSIHSSPNKPEKKLIKLFADNDLPYKFVGDGSFIIGRWNPDFVQTNGKKCVIELFGEHWHTEPNNEEKRKKCFAEFGFRTLVIWCKELEDMEKVLSKVKSFDTGDSQCQI